MELKDYLHLYLGCAVEFGYENAAYKGSRNIGKLEGYDPRYGWIVFTPKSVMAPYKTVRTELIKPILRRLSDMTEGEAVECWKLTDPDREIEGWQVVDYFRRQGNFYEAKPFHYLLSKHFDLFGLIDAGLAIDKSTLK